MMARATADSDKRVNHLESQRKKVVDKLSRDLAREEAKSENFRKLYED